MIRISSDRGAWIVTLSGSIVAVCPRRREVRTLRRRRRRCRPQEAAVADLGRVGAVRRDAPDDVSAAVRVRDHVHAAAGSDGERRRGERARRERQRSAVAATAAVVRACPRFDLTSRLFARRRKVETTLGARRHLRVPRRLTVTSAALFAVLRERAGADHVDLELPEGGARGRCAGRAVGPRGRPDVRDGGQPRVRRRRLRARGRRRAGADPAGIGWKRSRTSRSASGPLSIDALATLVRDRRAGAVVTFSGVTREVGRLEYEAYTRWPKTAMRDIVDGGDRAARPVRGGRRAPRRARAAGRAVRDRRRERAAPRRRPSTARARSSTRSRTRAPIWKREVEGDERRWVPGSDPRGGP